MSAGIHRPAIELWEEKTQRLANGCLFWTAHKDAKGYGQFRPFDPATGTRKSIRAHKWIWEQKHGPVPEGLELDHVVCQFTSCVDDTHLEPVTHKVNVLRGKSPQAINARKTHCIHGHEFTEENTVRYENSVRTCRTCLAKRRDISYRRTRQPDPSRPPKTHCANGHPYDQVTLYRDPYGNHQCRVCRRRNQNEYMRRKREAA